MAPDAEPETSARRPAPGFLLKLREYWPHAKSASPWLGSMTERTYQELLPLGPDTTPYRVVTRDYISTFEAKGRTFLEVEPEALTLLTSEAMRDIAHLLRPGHLAQLPPPPPPPPDLAETQSWSKGALPTTPRVEPAAKS